MCGDEPNKFGSPLVDQIYVVRRSFSVVGFGRSKKNNSFNVEINRDTDHRTGQVCDAITAHTIPPPPHNTYPLQPKKAFQSH